MGNTGEGRSLASLGVVWTLEGRCLSLYEAGIPAFELGNGEMECDRVRGRERGEEEADKRTRRADEGGKSERGDEPCWCEVSSHVTVVQRSGMVVCSCVLQ